MSTLTSNGSVSANIGNDSISKDISFTLTLSGSNVTEDIKNINTATWQGLNTSSLADLRYLVGGNIGTGSVQIARDGAGSNVIATMAPNDTCLVPCSGSVATNQLYAKAVDFQSILSYLVCES